MDTGSGGGIFNNEGALTVTNSTFSCNNATKLGGAILTDSTRLIWPEVIFVVRAASGDNCSSGDFVGTFNDNGYNLSE